jgi:hypothetical protein
MVKQPTENQKKIFSQVVEKVRKGEKISISREIKESGVYADSMVAHPEKITRSKGWQYLLHTHLSDKLLSETHHDLLKSTTLDHMVFPIGVKTNDEKKNYYLKREQEAKKKGEEYKHIEILSDEDINELLLSVNCTVKKIIHGEQARHVYFWSADNRARKDGLDMAYKLKGKYAPEKQVNLNVNVTQKEKDKIDRILGIK